MTSQKKKVSKISKIFGLAKYKLVQVDREILIAKCTSGSDGKQARR
jgi:hypothetical protein